MPLIVHKLDANIAEGVAFDFPANELIQVYSGVYSLKYLYYLLHEYFVENGWCKPAENQFREDQFLQRDHAAGKEIFIRWRLSKDTGDYYIEKYEIDLIMHCLAMQETEALVGGKKVKLDKGEIELKFQTRLIFNSKLAKSWFMDKKKHPLISKWFENTHLVDKINYHGGAFLNDINKIQDAVKEYFDIERYLGDRELLEFFKNRMGE